MVALSCRDGDIAAMSTNRPAIDQQITFFYTEDGPRAWAFYEQVIGLPLVLDQGGCRIYRVAGEAYVGFCHRAQKRAVDGALFTIVSNDVDDWAEYLRALGVKLEHEPRHNPAYGIYHFFFRDPDGYLVEVQRFDDAGWNC